jgi:hypothetical protein
MILARGPDWQMKAAAIALLLSLLLVCGGCRSYIRAETEKPPLSRCLQEISEIPVFDFSKKARKAESADVTDRPLEGMQIALTINGLIRSHGEPEKGIDNWCAEENKLENLDRLIEALRQNGAPPTVAFLIGRAFDPVAAEKWLQSGNLIGNMTYSGKKARKKNGKALVEDIDRNDKTVSPLWSKYRPKQKYFRLPQLKNSRDPNAREMIEGYLKQNGYIDVPASIEVRDYKFAQVYCASMARGEQLCLNLVKEYFKRYLLDTTLRTRAVAQRLAGRDIKYILMIGASQLTSELLGEILAWYRWLGAEFIPLDEAIKDPFYREVNKRGNNVGRQVISKVRRAQRPAVATP